MKIQPIQSPNFGLKVTRKIRFDSDQLKRVVDTVHLENGKKLIITKAYECNTLVSKLQYLKNEAGDWIKSKLKYYKGRQVIKELTSEAKAQEK